jgi:hypothetical protein
MIVVGKRRKEANLTSSDSSKKDNREVVECEENSSICT